jgi:hypothetical protein
MFNCTERSLIQTLNQVDSDIMDLLDAIDDNEPEEIKRYAYRIHNRIAMQLTFTRVEEESNG